MTAPDLATLKKRHLWPHQADAVDVVENYLSEHRAGRAKGSALVRLPTGTGKTGIIAVAARLLAPSGVVVVVCPSTALRDQLHEEIEADFWTEKLKVGVPRPRLAVKDLAPSTLKDELDLIGQDSAILVGTIQSLAQIHREKKKQYERLKKRASLLIFDEGHREPARHWGEVSRSLGCPSVLFSATPYRNDYALFAIDPKHIITFSFHDALKFRCIRDVAVVPAAFRDATTFVDAVEKVLQKADKAARVIVRCDTKDAISNVVASLTVRGHHAIGIHHNYRSTDGADFRSGVPDPDLEPARIWVHQYKLLEGIDDPRFSIVAIYDPFSNARSLVQQVGRVIRNPTLKTAKPAVLLVHQDQGQREFWERYLEFERAYDPGKHDVRDLIAEAVKNQPTVRYLDGDFRRFFDPYAPGFEALLRVPRSANIYRLKNAWDPAALLHELIAEWEDGDRLHLNSAQPDNDTVVALYTDAANSPVLLRDYFIEDRLGFTLVHRHKDLIFYVDTGGTLSEAVRELAQPLSVEEMHWLFGQATRAVSMSMRNTDFNRYAFRHRSVRAYSLLDAATGLTDHGYFCSTAEGYEKSPNATGDLRRYIGVDKGRIRETTPPGHDLAAFRGWASAKANELAKLGTAHRVFDRFATHIGPPADTAPRHLLLDVAELVERQAYKTRTDGQELQIHDVAVPVAGNRCTIVANGKSYTITITYDPDRQRYRLNCDELDDDYTVRDATDRFRRGLIAHLNVEQSFRIVPGEGWSIYAHGYFVKPAAAVGSSRKSGLDLLRVLTPVPALASVTSEKGRSGTASVGTGWDPKSVFGVFDRCHDTQSCPTGAVPLQQAMVGLGLVVCDDIGDNEAADFICADPQRRRVVLVHAKHKETKRSASVFQEVCGQLVKNLDLLMPFSAAEPPNLKHWGGEWRLNPIGEVARIRSGPNTGAGCWAMIRELLRDPEAQREVWILCGKMLEISWLGEQQRKSKPEAEAVQMFYLLQSTWTAVSSIGAKLRIFAMP